MNTHLTDAVKEHQRGQLDAAKALYRRVLDADPRQPDALHFLGVIARQQNDPTLAVQLINQAITLRPDQASQHCNLGAALQDLKRSDEALRHYEKAVQLDPQYALAFSNRGNALRHLGRFDEALASYERALALRPAYPEAWCNRAITLNDLGRHGEAIDSAERALAARPDYADAWVARANALQGQGSFTEALDSYEQALARKNDGEIHCSRGTALQRLQRFDDALASYERAIAMRPDHPLAHHYRANTLRALGRIIEAIDAYRHALALGGDSDQIGFALAALGAGDAPAASPAAYVKELFDGYAEHFDEHLVGQLDYNTPALLDAMIAAHGVSDAEVVDLGCGTGLCGPYLRPLARRLTGVDLSSKMLDKARARGLYDVLVCADIGDYLTGRAAEIDLLVAADVLVYLGDLSALFRCAAAALRPGGLFCLSVEAGEGDGFTLLASQRYAHSLGYLQRQAREHAFALLAHEHQPLRRDGERQVFGHVVMLKQVGM